MTRSMLLPLVPLYRLGLALRERRFQPDSPAIHRLRRPVISIGNLSTGGSGKTPLTIALAKALTARGVHVDVLSRGYGRRRSAAAPVLVEVSGRPSDFGDEPLEIARATQALVYVASERYDAGSLAERTEPDGIHLLDDGFQHRQLYRDVDVLLLSRADFADRLLPAGNLREALNAAARAHVIAIPADAPELESEIRSRGWRAQIWRLRRQMDVPHVDGPVAAFCGIARPEQFFAGLEQAGAHLAARFAFRDHHCYAAADFNRIVSATQKAGATLLLTTEKDRVRLGALADSLPSTLRLQAVPLRTEIENEPAAIDWLLDHLRGPR
jgi:tetraacyldisaccharide 4'-kinase